MKKVIKKSTFCIITDESLIEIHFYNDVTIDIIEMNEALALIEELSGRKSFKLLWVLNEYTYTTMEAMLERINHNQIIQKKIIAEAIVAQSIHTRLLEKFYFSRCKKYFPIMIFNNIATGKLWLKSNSVIDLITNPN